MTNRTFGECMYDVMCRPTQVQVNASPVTTVKMVTRVVHDPTCQLPAMMHGMVTDRTCLVHLTMIEK